MSDWNDSNSSRTSTAPSNVDPAQVRATLPLATTLASVAKKLLGALGVSIISHAVQMDPALCKSLDWPSPDDLAPAYAAAARSGGRWTHPSVVDPMRMSRDRANHADQLADPGLLESCRGRAACGSLPGKMTRG